MQTAPQESGGFSRALGSSALAASFCALVATAVYLGVLEANFVRWDDNWLVYENPRLRGLTWSSLRDVLINANPSSTWYTPLTGLRYNALEHFFGLDSRAFHAANLLVHAVDAALVVWLVRALLLSLRGGVDTPATRLRDNLAATAAALLWALHPLRVEVVGWVSAGAHEQALFFLLLAMLAHLKAVRPGQRFSSAWEELSALAYLASVLSQPMGLGFPGIVIAFDWWISRRTEGTAARPSLADLLRQAGPHLAVCVVVLVLNVVLHFQSPIGGHRPVSLAAFGIFPRVAQASYLLVYYVWRPFVPFGLSPVYTRLIDFDPWSPPFVASVLAVLSAALVAWKARRHRPGWWALGLSYFFLLAPMLGWTDHPYYPNDRYSLSAALLGSVGVAVLLSTARNERRAIGAGLLVGLLALGLIPLTVRQCGIWRNSETLFRYMVTVLGDDPARAEIQWRLGLDLENQRRFQEAAEQYGQVLVLAPQHPIAAQGLLRACGEGGSRSRDEALACYRRVSAAGQSHTSGASGVQGQSSERRTEGPQLTAQGSRAPRLREWFAETGYFFILGLFACCAAALLFAWREVRSRPTRFWTRNWPGAVLAIVIASLAFTLVPHRHRVLNDELQLLSVAHSMTLHHDAWMEREVWTHNPNFEPEFWIDKRPLVFPFLISAAHTLTGYRPANVFALNAVLFAGFLFALYSFLRRYLPWTLCVAALLLVAAQPIVLLCATSGGYEICYLLLLVLVLLGLRHFLDAPSTPRLQLLVFLLLLLANVQYTAGLMLVFALGAIAAFGFLRWRFLSELSLLPLAPLFLLPVIGQRLIMLQTPDPSFPAGSAASAFGWKYLVHNVAVLPEHLFSLAADSALAGAVNIAGAFAAGGLLLWLLRRRSALPRDSRVLILVLIAYAGATLAILLFYYSGMDGHWMNGRLYLSFVVLLSVAPALLAHAWFGERPVRDVVVLGAAAIALLVYAPLARTDPLFRTGQFTQELDFLVRYWEAHPLKNSLVIYKMSQEFAPFRTDAINMKTARRWRDLVVAQRDGASYENIYVVQSTDCRSGAAFALDVFDPTLPLTKVAETATIKGMCIRLSLLK